MNADTGEEIGHDAFAVIRETIRSMDMVAIGHVVLTNREHISVYRETEVERRDLETIITDLISGQFNDPVRVVAFNTLEHWLEDVSKQIADEMQTRCDIEGVAIPEHVIDFVARHTGAIRQLSLRLV